MKTHKRIATLSAMEDARWIELFAEAIDAGATDEDADEETWEIMREEFPRLQAFDGIAVEVDAARVN